MTGQQTLREGVRWGFLLTLASVCFTLSAVGCGGQVSEDPDPSAKNPGQVAAEGDERGAPSSDPEGTATDTSDWSTPLGQLFVDLAAAAAPMPVYGLPELPQGATLPEEWWPVIDLESPSDYVGPVIANPRVLGEPGSDPEIQVVLQYEEGWIALIENFRGDLGETEGEKTDGVAGRPATLYRLDGTVLIQWSDGGRWYGVFGRGVSEQIVLEVTKQVRIVPTVGSGV